MAARVEAHFMGDLVDQPAREKPVERRLGGEPALEKRAIGGGLLHWDERLAAPRSAKKRGVDARRRGEAGSRHAPDEAQLVPRSPRAAEHRRRPDRGALRGQAPLHDCVELCQLHVRIAQKTPEDRGAHRERQIRDDGERLVGQPHDGRVVFHHLDTGIVAEAGVELLEPSGIELDRAHAGACVRKGACQDAAAGAEVEHERAGLDAGVADELVCVGAATK
jgi:hypothetical protein